MAMFTDVDLAMIAIILDEEEEVEQQMKKGKWVHEAWKKRETEGEFATLYKELIGDETTFLSKVGFGEGEGCVCKSSCGPPSKADSHSSKPYHPMKAHLNHGVVSSRFKRSTKSSTEMSIEEKEAHEQVEMTTKRKIAESGDSVHTRTLPFKCSPHSGQQAVQELGERPGSNSSKGKCSKRVQKSKSKQIGVQRETKARGRMTRGTSNGGASDCSEEGAVVDFSFVKEELNSNDLVIKEHNVGEYFLKEEMDGMDEVVVKEKNVDESLMDEDEFHVKVDSSLDYIMKEEHEIDERLKEEPGGMPAEDCNGKEVKEWCIEGCIIKQEVVEEL
ncbi:uncharacterized protein LOC143034476 isoform X2 [Oratosquilla oratoria]|uniref:uncharacterized protein LOC143034476 isoform X2 n=1 Tax=Oratosquilla oratoria TaxID=337810 RepID=UPI003F758086